MLDKLLSVKIADIHAHSEVNQATRIWAVDKAYGLSQLIMYEQQCFTLKDLAINGYVVMEHFGVESGPKVGEVLNHLLDKVIDGEIENDLDVLLEEAKRYLKGD